jgi:hypothetical protein
MTLPNERVREWAAQGTLYWPQAGSYTPLINATNDRNALAREVLALRVAVAGMTTLVELGMTYVTEPGAYEFMWDRLETLLGHPPLISREIIPQSPVVSP